MSKWNDCNTCVPQYDERVLLYVPDRCSSHILIGYIIHPSHRGKDLDGNQYYWFADESENTAFLIDEVTHWMPLPGLPNELK